MLTDYIRAAMKHATYKLLEDGTYFGEIRECHGAWGNAPTLEACRDELQSGLEGWIILGLRLGHKLPVIDGLDLTPPLEVEEEVEEAHIV